MLKKICNRIAKPFTKQANFDKAFLHDLPCPLLNL